MSFEVFFGIRANSLAVLTDAADLFADSCGFLLNILSIHWARSKASETHTFGWLKAESLGAFCSLLLIWVLYLQLMYTSISNLITGVESIDAKVVFIISMSSFALNIIKICILTRTGKKADTKGKDKKDEKVSVNKK